MKLSLVKITIILTIVAVAITFATAQSDWEQFQKDEVSSGQTANSAPVTTPDTTVSWSHYTNAGYVGIETAPIVVGDYVYVLTSNNNNAYLYKYYKNGTTAGGNWPITIGPGNFQNSNPAYGEGNVFVINTGFSSNPQPDLYAINASTGNKEWGANVTESTGIQFSSQITYYEDGNDQGWLFFASVNMSGQDPVNLSDDGIYYCYYANNGTQVWSRNTNSGGGYYWAGAAVIGDYLVYGDDESNVTSVYAKNGTTVSETNVSALWDNFDAKQIRSSIAYNESMGRIYFTSKAGYCFALGFYANGTFNTSDRWRRSIGYSTSTPAVYNGKIYVGHSSGFYNGKLHCLYETNGTQEWETSSIGPVQSSPVISTWYDNGTNNEIYIYVTTNSNSGGLYCIDKDGDEVWQNTSLGNNKYCLGGAAVSDGWVFYGNDGGYLHGLANWTRYDFDVGSGEDKWAFRWQNNSRPPNTCDVPSNEFTSYTNIRTDNGQYQTDVTDANGNYAVHRFNFSIDNNEVKFITKINVTWNGKGWHDNGGNDNGTYLYIWNGTGYEELANNSGVGTDATLTGEVTSGISNYISSGNVTMLAEQKSVDAGRNHRSHIETDYVKLVVTP
ncbi:MAG: PQQ-binding-like beta-propeller repeat protein [Methanosarcinales archaeon]|nr:PQQ-binding-like beta-propeller repeat protein [Methanosarcinales archaeon]